jgi:hypothetical protein
MNKKILKEKTNKNDEIFTNDEIKKIKDLVKDYSIIKTIIDNSNSNKLTLKKNDEKIKRSISMNVKIDEKILKKKNEYNLNYSEMVNRLIQMALKYLK